VRPARHLKTPAKSGILRQLRDVFRQADYTVPSITALLGGAPITELKASRPPLLHATHLGGGALARGDKVVAAARSVKSLSDLAEEYGDAVLPLALDVTKREKVEAVIPKAHARFGRLDVVINNAGYASLGAVEEATEQGSAEFETNFFGALAVIQTVLPLLRTQAGGHILGVSSVAGGSAGPVMSFYNAFKWAFEALHEGLSKEVVVRAAFAERLALWEARLSSIGARHGGTRFSSAAWTVMPPTLVTKFFK